MQAKLYQVDAFTDRVFAGNPAAVCVLQSWLDEPTMQRIARENNLSETAFVVRRETLCELRWFTPTTEVDLCGHATLATAFVLREKLADGADHIKFHTRSGPLTVHCLDDGLYTMDFPAMPAQPCAAPPELADGLGDHPSEVLAAMDYLAVFDTEDAVLRLRPDYRRLAALDRRGVIVTAPASAACDFVSRYFAPGHGIDEDPVTGSAHCTLTPYWAERLGKSRLAARQVSERGGTLTCEVAADRVLLSGRAVLYLDGEIHF